MARRFSFPHNSDGLAEGTCRWVLEAERKFAIGWGIVVSTMSLFFIFSRFYNVIFYRWFLTKQLLRPIVKKLLKNFSLGQRQRIALEDTTSNLVCQSLFHTLNLNVYVFAGMLCCLCILLEHFWTCVRSLGNLTLIWLRRKSKNKFVL